METFEKADLSTMTSCTAYLTKEGFTENFVATETGIEAPTNKKTYIPDEIRIVNFYRFEGESDPADNSILYAIETNDGVKGMLIDSYGSTASERVGKFIREVEDIEKKKHNKPISEVVSDTDKTDDNEEKKDQDKN